MEGTRLRVKKSLTTPEGGKVWRVIREGFTMPIAAFYTWEDAERYADKISRVFAARA